MEIPIIQQHVPVAGVMTEVLHMAARTDADAQLQVLIVPGNPGNAGFYRGFMRILHSALGGRAHIVSCSHAGHDPAHTQWGEKLWNLNDQIQHKVDFLREHLLLSGRPPLVILAHSIGSYITVHAVQRFEEPLQRLTHPHTENLAQKVVEIDAPPHFDPAPQPDPLMPVHTPGHAGERAWLGQVHEASSTSTHMSRVPPIVKVVALMPFFEANLSGQWRQRLLYFLARRYKAVSGLAGGIRMLPLTVRMMLVNMWTGGTMSKEAVHTTSSLLHPASMRNNFYMALHEFQELARPFQWDLLRRLKNRLHVVACPKDIWMSEEVYQDMHHKVPGLQSSWHGDLKHAFCVSERECHQVAQHIVKVVIAPCMASMSGVTIQGQRTEEEGTPEKESPNGEKGGQATAAQLVSKL